MKIQLATVFLGPFLLLQGRWVRAVVPKLPEPEGPREGRDEPDALGAPNVGAPNLGAPNVRILIVGDSSALGIGAETQDVALTGRILQGVRETRPVAWRLIAESGATTARVIEIVREADAEPFDVAVTALGINDLTAGCSAREWQSRLRSLDGLLRERFEVRRVVYSGLPPIGKFPALPNPLRWYLGARREPLERALADFVAETEHADHVSLEEEADPVGMSADGFHPGPPIYERWGTHIGRLIGERWGPAA